MTTARKSIPEIGDLVHVRARRWIVTDIKPTGLSSPIPCQHRVDLISIEEDARSETSSVIWEIEPGASIEDLSLPDLRGVDDYTVFESFLNAVRWGVATNVNSALIQSPFRSGITIEDYQLDPVVRAVNMANVNLLIADDVGLGKTIEAGLVVQELLLRHRARTVLVVCPASLQIKWQEELRAKFGLEFRIVNTEYMCQLRRRRGVRANPWTSYPRLITSMDWAKDGDGLEFMEEALPARPDYPRTFDILIVDEAHNVAPSSSGEVSKRTQFIRLIAPHFSHHLFLTATPHNGNPRSWQGLLELLDKQRFQLGVEPDAQQLGRVLVRRLKSALTDKDGNALFPAREMNVIPVDYTEEEHYIHELLNHYQKLLLQTANATIQSRKLAGRGIQFVLLVLKKRLFSSPRAFAQTLACHAHTLSQLESGEKRREKKKEDYGFLLQLIEKAELVSEKPYQAENGLIDDPETDAVEQVTGSLFLLTQDEQQILQELQDWANNHFSQSDSKIEAILTWIQDHLCSGDGQWNERRVILFTEYTATLSLLHELLTSRGLGDEDRLMVIDGSTSEEKREEIKAAFQADPAISKVRILLATDAASEGIDLQNWCSDLIHVEIPWNPNVMEQRNGRIDRHGQKAKKVNIWHPVGKGRGEEKDKQSLDADADFLWRICKKVNKIRDDLGSVSDLISEEVRQKMLGLEGDEFATSVKEHKRQEEVRKWLQAEKNIAAKTRRCHERLLQTQRELHLKPNAIKDCVQLALALAGKPPLKIHQGGSAQDDLYELPELTGSWSAAYAGITDPFTHKVRPVTFDHEIAKRLGQNVVLLHLNHPLVAQSLRFLRETVWSPDASRHLNRIAVCRIPDAVLEDIGVIVYSRLVVTGSDGSRLHEEVTIAGGLLKNSGFVQTTKIGTLNEWLNAARGLCRSGVKENIQKILEFRYHREKEMIKAASQSRAQDRREALECQLERRCEVEKKAIEEVLLCLRDSIRKTLTGSELSEDDAGFQADLFASADMNLWDVQHVRKELEQRIEQIPDEIESEKRMIEERFRITDQDIRNFPIGLMFLVPESKV